MISEVIDSLYYQGDFAYPEVLIISTKSGVYYNIYPDGFEKIAPPVLTDYLIDLSQQLSGLSVVKLSHNHEEMLIELSDRRFIQFYRCSGFIDFLEGRKPKIENELTIISEDEYDEYKRIIDETEC